MKIHGYILEGDLQTRSGGNCRWGFARKGTERFFIKELLSPVYPTDDAPLSDRLRELKRKGCKDFALRQAFLYRVINDCSDGTLVHIHEFFRCGSHYYVTMPAVNSLPEETVRSTDFTAEDRYRVGRLLVFSMDRLHRANLIHGDLKMSNVLLTRLRSGHITAGIVDFEDSYFTDEIRKPGESIRVDQRYMAPEIFRLMTGEEVRLTQSVDVFSLGLIIHEILTGRFPGYDSKYDYPFEAVLSGGEVATADWLPGPFDVLLPRMLAAEPERRISLSDAKRFF